MREGVLPTRNVMSRDYAKKRREKLDFVFRYKVRARIVANAARKYLEMPAPLRILDLGSADGLTLIELHSLLPSATYFGVEYSDELLQFVPDFFSNIQIIKGAVEHLPESIKKHSYDIVSALAILEYLPDPLEAVIQAASVLRPGGIFVATCPHPWWDNLTVPLRSSDKDKEDYIKILNKELMVYLVEKAGMELLVYERFMFAPICFLPYLKIPVSPSLSLICDKIIRSLKVFDSLFVNQCIIARKPA